MLTPPPPRTHTDNRREDHSRVSINIFLQLREKREKKRVVRSHEEQTS